ncbi:unnamed protein product [Coccothraustes coccothraustes]
MGSGAWMVVRGDSGAGLRGRDEAGETWKQRPAGSSPQPGCRPGERCRHRNGARETRPWKRTICGFILLNVPGITSDFHPPPPPPPAAAYVYLLDFDSRNKSLCFNSSRW